MLTNSRDSQPMLPTSYAPRWPSRKHFSKSPETTRIAATDELVDRLLFVNTRAIDLTEALLLLSRADRRSFIPESVDLSLIAEEATETLLPLAEKRGITIETSGQIDTHSWL